MKIHKAADRPSKLATSQWFTGRVWQEPIIETQYPARVHALKVSFEPRARTAWHTHPLGQTLYVLSGTGLIALRGRMPKTVLAGDTVWIPPHEEHWHGASPMNAMVHVAIQEALNGSVADWLEHVSEEDYEKGR